MCVSAAKKRAATTMAPSGTTPSVTTTTTMTHSVMPPAGNSKRTRSIAVQHNVVPILLGHGFRAFGDVLSQSQQDIFADSQDDDLQLTQNTPPDPTSQPGSQPQTNDPSVSQFQPGQTGGNNMQVIQDSFKAVQDGLSAISSYIMGGNAQSGQSQQLGT